MASILLVDPDLAYATALANGLARGALGTASRSEVAALAEFAVARARIHVRPPHLLVAALRLGEYNGLHLVYTLAAARQQTRSVVYTDQVDTMQAREVRAAGAFYEVRSRLAVAIPRYVSAALPPQDRREAVRFDRRHWPRGGRRAVDLQPTA